MCWYEIVVIQQELFLDWWSETWSALDIKWATYTILMLIQPASIKVLHVFHCSNLIVNVLNKAHAYEQILFILH